METSRDYFDKYDSLPEDFSLPSDEDEHLVETLQKDPEDRVVEDTSCYDY